MALLLINGLRDVGTLRMVSEPCRESMAPLIFLEDNGFIEVVVAQSNVVAMAGGARLGPSYAAPASAPNRFQYSTPASLPSSAQQQPQPQVSAPVQATAPQYDSRPNQMARQQMQDKINNLLSYVSRTLGEDANLVHARIEAIRTEQEFEEMIKKIYVIISGYRSVKDAEKFMQIFNG